MKALLTIAEWVGMLASIKGTTFATLETETIPKMRKTNNPYLGVKKHSKVNGELGSSYVNKIIKMLHAEGRHADAEAYEPKAMAWGTLRKGTCIIDHKDKLYVRMFVKNVLETKYTLNGRELTEEEVIDLKTFMNSSSNPTHITAYNMESIKAVTMFKQTFKVA
jgi:hypothetical protein